MATRSYDSLSYRLSEQAMTPSRQLADLIALSEKATPGPWRSMRDGNQYIKTDYMPTAKLVGASRLDGLLRPWNPHAYIAFGFKPREFETVRLLDEDADFIEAAHNAIPALVALLSRLQEAEALVADVNDADYIDFDELRAKVAAYRAKYWRAALRQEEP